MLGLFYVGILFMFGLYLLFIIVFVMKEIFFEFDFYLYEL